MVRTRSQLENISKKKLIKKLITVDDISAKLSELSNRFDNLLRRFEVLSSDLAITKKLQQIRENYPIIQISGYLRVTELSERVIQLAERVIQLESNAVTNAQYHRQELV